MSDKGRTEISSTLSNATNKLTRKPYMIVYTSLFETREYGLQLKSEKLNLVYKVQKK